MRLSARHAQLATTVMWSGSCSRSCLVGLVTTAQLALPSASLLTTSLVDCVMQGLYVSVVRPCGIRLAWVQPQAKAGHAYPARTALEALPMILAARLENSRQHLVLLCVMTALLASFARATRQCRKFVLPAATVSQGRWLALHARQAGSVLVRACFRLANVIYARLVSIVLEMAM